SEDNLQSELFERNRGKAMWLKFFRGIAGAIGIVALASSTLVAAQDYPNRPIRIVVPNTPGSGPDIVARMVGTEMSKLLGQSVIVENRPGAAQIIGYEYGAKAPADGYTLVSTISHELAL